MRPGAPLVLINTSDLGHGVRFTFVQEYFNLLCSNLSTFPLARAVTASSAVPVVFDPVVVENYSGCSKGLPSWLPRQINHLRELASPEPGLCAPELSKSGQKLSRNPTITPRPGRGASERTVAIDVAL
jgi:hypothetical protein